MKRTLLVFAVLLLFVAGCTGDFNFFSAQTDAQSYLDGEDDEIDVDFNFCTVQEGDEDYIYCDSFALTSDTLEMVMQITSSDVDTLDSIVFELPDEGEYCTAEVDGNGYMWSDDGETYYVSFSTSDADVGDDCDFSDYVGQDTQLAFQLTLTMTDSSVVTLEGDVEDAIQEDE